jgi:hypothetical protein
MEELRNYSRNGNIFKNCLFIEKKIHKKFNFAIISLQVKVFTNPKKFHLTLTAKMKNHAKNYCVIKISISMAVK